MKLTDLNRYGGVGASSMLVELGGARILIDAGLHPKRSGRDATPDLRLLEQRPPDLIIVTHCHLDHLGSLPLVVRQCPNVPVLMSVPSQLLAERLLRNSVNVMKREREEKSAFDLPLYTMAEVDATVARIVPMLYGQPRKLSVGHDDVEITFFPSGHVPGAAGVQLAHKHRTFFFTGDVQFDDQRLVGGAKFPSKRFDVVVTETTRGATERDSGKDRASEVARLIRTIDHVIGRGGSVLIPVFALGRMQEIFLLLHEARLTKKLPPVPVFAAGLGMDLGDLMDDVAKKTGLCHFTRAVTKELKVKPPPRKLTPGREPGEKGIYVLSSGMLVENTPSYAMAASLLGHAANAICFVGYSDPDTPGGRLLAARKGETFVFDALQFQTPVRCSIERFEMTGHADREELLEFALHGEPRQIVLTHGDPPARAWFAEQIAGADSKVRVLDPVPGQTYEL
ncbi:MAG: MBL fold metallo-hydrolase [Opitutaceae bacterium]|nr:MBL fold metallo-hydrolase [Opitutaceae bacterium]